MDAIMRIDDYFNTESSWYNRRTIRRCHRINPADQIGFIPEPIRIKLIENKLSTNRPWDNEHIEWIRDETTELYFIDDSWVMFQSIDDLALFVLKFEGSK